MGIASPDDDGSGSSGWGIPGAKNEGHGKEGEKRFLGTAPLECFVGRFSGLRN